MGARAITQVVSVFTRKLYMKAGTIPGFIELLTLYKEKVESGEYVPYNKKITV